MALKACAIAEKQHVLSILEILENSEQTYTALTVKVERLTEIARPPDCASGAHQGLA
jgi:hypothetical protein